MANEATIVMATMAALRPDAQVAPAVATEAARRYQNNVASITALGPTLQAFRTPVIPQISDSARSAAQAAYGSAAQAAAAAAAHAAPVGYPPSDETTVLQEATIIAATMIALYSGAPVEPAVATEAIKHYQDNIASITALQPTPQPTPQVTPQPTVEWQTPTPQPTPDLQGVPVATLPGSLAGVTLPATQDAAAALFAAMPSAVAGADRDAAMSRILPSLMQVSYGQIPIPESTQTLPRIIFSAGDRAGDPFRPGWTGAQIITYMAREEIPDQVTSWGRDGHLYWIRGVAQPPDPQRTIPNEMLLIGSDSSTWLFSLLATSPEELDALENAITEAL
jgi:hypothetical protein